MKTKTRSHELLNIFNCIKDLSGKYSRYLSYLSFLVSVYTSMIIEVMNNESRAIYIYLFF